MYIKGLVFTIRILFISSIAVQIGQEGNASYVKIPIPIPFGIGGIGIVTTLKEASMHFVMLPLLIKVYLR
jgi:hypothetical protein